MSIEKEIGAVFRLIKEHLKAKQISYANLAERLEMSESNVKRIFSSESCSLHQLAQICEAADTSFIDLVAIARKKISPEFILPAETEEFFMKNFDAFVFFRHLFGAQDPRAIVKNSKLPADRVRLFLRKFEDFNLIKQNDGKIKINGAGYLNMSECPNLNNYLSEKWTPWFIDQALRQKKNPQYYLKSSSTGLSPVHRAQLIEDLELVLQRYMEIGFQDQRIGAGDFESVGICIGIGPHRIGFFEDGYTPTPHSRRY